MSELRSNKTPETWKEVADMGRIIRQIRTQNPKAVPFLITPDEIKQITYLAQEGDWQMMLRLYSYPFLVALLAHYETVEDFEKCSAIKAEIDAHIQFVRQQLPHKQSFPE